MNTDLIDYYYNKILSYGKEYKMTRNIKKRKDDICNYLNEFINTNKDYLLTDSFLNCISRDESIVNELKYILSDYTCDTVKYLSYYYQIIVSDILNFFPTKYRDLMDDDTRLATFYASKLIKKINDDNDFKYKYNTLMCKKMLYITLSYCHINNKMNNYQEIIDYLLNNEDNILDDLEMNNIKDFNELFIQRILYTIENNYGYKKIIK